MGAEEFEERRLVLEGGRGDNHANEALVALKERYARGETHHRRVYQGQKTSSFKATNPGNGARAAGKPVTACPLLLFCRFNYVLASQIYRKQLHLLCPACYIDLVPDNNRRGTVRDVDVRRKRSSNTRARTRRSILFRIFPTSRRPLQFPENRGA